VRKPFDPDARSHPALRFLAGLLLVLASGCAQSPSPIVGPAVARESTDSAGSITTAPEVTGSADRITPTPRPSSSPGRTATTGATSTRALPRPTSTAVASADPLVLFADTFSEGCFRTADDDQRSYGCQQGRFEMFGRTPGARWVFYDGETRDATIEVSASLVAGGGRNVEYGLAFHVSEDARQFYGFTVSRYGRYSFFRYDHPRFVDLVPSTESGFVRKGSATNLMTVTAQDDRFTLFVNGQLLRTVRDRALSQGKFGFFLLNDEPLALAAFDNLLVRQIRSAPALHPPG
jgi:hypothetical protein